MTEVIFDVWVDGSYNLNTKISGGGVFIRILNNKEEEFKEGDLNTDLLEYSEGYFLADMIKIQDECGSRNVTGEILAVNRAISIITQLEENCEIKNILTRINYDYKGIEEWANGNWRSKIPLTKDYTQNIREFSRRRNVVFNRIKSHTGVAYNELVDSLAKDACGIKR